MKECYMAPASITLELEMEKSVLDVTSPIVLSALSISATTPDVPMESADYLDDQSW